MLSYKSFFLCTIRVYTLPLNIMYTFEDKKVDVIVMDYLTPFMCQYLFIFDVCLRSSYDL